MSATVRISKRSHKILKRLSEKLDVSMVEALDLVTDKWQRQEFLNAVNSAYAELKKSTDAWDEMIQERDDWDSTLMDGIDDREHE